MMDLELLRKVTNGGIESLVTAYTICEKYTHMMSYTQGFDVMHIRRNKYTVNFFIA